MRRLNLTVEIEDNDWVQLAFEKEIKELLGSSIVDFRVVPNDQELYKNDHKYRELSMKVKAAKRAKYEYYSKKRDDIK